MQTMATAAVFSRLHCVGASLSATEGDVLVMPWFEGDAPHAVAGLDQASGGELARALASGEFSGRLYECFVTAVLDPSWHARRLLFIGAGKRGGVGGETLRKVAAAAGLWGKQRRIQRVGFVIPAIAHSD